MVQTNEQGKVKAKTSHVNKPLFARVYVRIHRIMSSFTVKIGIVICAQTIVLSLAIIFFFYSESKRILLRDLNSHLTNLAHLSVLTFTDSDIKKIVTLKNIINDNNQTLLSNAKNKFLNPE